jgi:UDP-N-acetylmuramoyl-tripeptide--D-alanyl-D-alanine ligase
MKIILKILTFILKNEAILILKKYKPKIIGITGNVGKTSTKNAVYCVLKNEKKVRTSFKNFNNELGLPASIIGEIKGDFSFCYWLKTIFLGLFNIVFRNKNYPEIIILEYGIDKPNDMNYLLEIAKPDIGIMNPVGKIPVHIEFFENRTAIVKEKAKLIKAVPSTGFAILNADSKDIDYLKDASGANLITYGTSKNADVKIKNFKNNFDKKTNSYFITFVLSYNGTKINFLIKNVIGKPAAYAIAAGFTVGLIFNIKPFQIKENIENNYKNPPGRENIITGIKNSTIIDDTYNASPEATEEALKTLSSLPAKRKIAVLGDMLELGIYTKESHEKIGEIAAKVCDLIFTVGEKAQSIRNGAIKNGFNPSKIYSFKKINEASQVLKSKIKSGDLILIKGSQGVRMEKITKNVMQNKELAEELLVRQTPSWLAKPGIYD